MKRFYKAAEAVETPAGWAVMLDGKPIRTPAKAAFAVPGRALAAAAAAEWAAQEELVRPAEMPLTRAVNTAIDRTAPEHGAVVDIVAAYGGTDLVSYRAETPEALRARQGEAWDPLIGWAEATHDARLVTTTGVMHALQPAEGQRRLRAAVAAHDAFRLTALYDLAALSGSLVIALAVAARRLAPAEGWRLSRIDETWQEELWGVDAEAEAMAARKSRDFNVAAQFLELLDKG